MSRPSSYHGANNDDDFSLPLFQHSSQHSYPHPQQPPPQHQNPLPSRSPRGLPPPKTQRGQQPLNVSTQPPPPPHPPAQQQPQLLPPGSPYAVAAYSASSPSTATNGGAPPKTAPAQRQTMHFPSHSPSAYPDDMTQGSGGGGGGGVGALGSLARSASLSTARRKDPFHYPSDDVESGMATGDWGATGASSYSGAYAPPTQQDRPIQQMPQPYINTNLRDRDVLMSPGASSRSPYQSQQPSSASMPPPPVPNTAHNRQQAPPASSPAQPGNPYVPRSSDGPAPPTDSWLSYRRSSAHHSSHSPQSGSASPLALSPLSPSLPPHHGDPSPHLLTPQGGHGNLPTSPRQMQSAGGFSSSSGSHSPNYYMPPPSSGHRSLSQSFAASQPVTPSGRYDNTGQQIRSKSRDRLSSSRQGFRAVRDWSDLKPHVNPHPAGRRADPDIPGAYLSPLKCLTQQLPRTYSLCNPSFKYESTDNPRRVLTKPSKPVYNDGADNEDWDYILFVNDVLGGEHGGDRYLILDVLGQGTFGQVVKCQNMRTHGIVAVKVVKNKPAYLNQSKMEVAILNLLNRDHDPRDEHHILRLLDSFTHKSHLCLVFECLSSNLYELIKQNQFKGLSLQLVRVFTQQLLDCLGVLKEARLIHCDLKPENILLKSLQSPQIKVIDFGSACHELQTVYTYIQSRFYRSPEVLLGLPYSTSIDMWSLGCIVVELFLGLPIFPGTSEYNQVTRITDMLGNPPGHLLEVGKQTNEFFNFVGVDAQGRKKYTLKPLDQYASEHRTKEQPSKAYFKQTYLPDIILEYPLTKKNAKQSEIDKEMGQRQAFINFVEGLLNLDPIKRWSPQQAAKHPFITGEKYTGPFEPPSVPTKRSTASSAPTPTKPVEPQTPAQPQTQPVESPHGKYGGLVKSPPSTRGQRVYSDAATYIHQLAQHQVQTAQAQAAQNAVRPNPFAPGYDAAQQQPSQQQSQQLQPQQQYTKGRVASGHAAVPQSWHQNIPPPAPQQQNYHRVPSGTTSQQQQAAVRPNIPVINAPTNPPPSTYFPSSRNRANTINHMDTIPAALARLTNLGAPDPQNRTGLTPVLHREEMAAAWEMRQQGGHKPSGLRDSTHAQLEYLQEQAELVNMNQSGYMMPGQYQGVHVPASHANMNHHRGSQSFSGTQAYQMHPSSGHTGHASHDFRGRVPAHSGSEYDPPSSSRAYGGLPAFPPPAATTTNSFDAFDTRDQSLGMMYTPLTPLQQPASPYAYSPRHAGRSSFSGQAAAYPADQRPFAHQGHSPNSPRRYTNQQQYGA